eukprot:1124273-Rhodomonas_salina.1
MLLSIDSEAFAALGGWVVSRVDHLTMAGIQLGRASKKQRFYMGSALSQVPGYQTRKEYLCCLPGMQTCTLLDSPIADSEGTGPGVQILFSCTELRRAVQENGA